MEKVIIVSAQKSNRSSNMVWAVSIQGEQPSAYCKSAFAAMRYMFLLKKQTGINISDNCLARLSHEIKEVKVHMAKMAWFKAREAEDHARLDAIAAEQRKEEEELQKKQRKPRTRKNKNASK